MTTKDGGPAFPGFTKSENLSTDYTPYAGISLRDWFAGMALFAMTNMFGNFQSIAEGSGIMSKAAYAIADAMLKERENGEASEK